ncbi:uncharacterized protein LOC108025120 [Drosophila biarmipes]|uniref:uncharacterized protein LOC108025120 n=1 Tax=Drosophila biarmipes TaxID=125945 RepID=UPI0007E717C4|nr:uncharacterized protein LOC108025120 [Drosophila biarmipes]
MELIRPMRLLIIVLVLILSARGDENVISHYESDYLETYARYMKSDMNLSVDPCDNFLEYSCGNHRHSSRLLWKLLGEWVGDYNTIHLADKIEHFLGRRALAESLNVSVELGVAHRFYNACLEADIYPFPAADPHYLELIRSIGGFPAVDGANWNASSFSWFNMSAHMLNYGAEGLILDEVHSEHPFEPDLSFQGQRMGFEKYVNGPVTNEERMGGYLRSFNLPEDKIAEVISGVLAFWEEAREVGSQGDLQGDCEAFETNYFKIVWNRVKPEKLRKCNSYFVEMDKVVARQPEAVANYLAMKLLHRFDARLRSAKGQKGYCQQLLEASMAFLFNKLYLAEHFTEEVRLDVTEVVEEVWSTLSRSLDEADRVNMFHKSRNILMDFPFNFTRANLYADRIISVIGGLQIVDDSYTATTINLHRLFVDTNRYNARHPEQFDKFSKSPDQMLDYIFDFDRFLQPPVYHPSWPASLKFGGLGSFIARHVYKNHYRFDYNMYRVEIKKLGLAFAAYKSHVEHLLEGQKQDKINATMPGLALSPDQLFFLGSTQIFCDSSIKRPQTRARYSLSKNQEFFKAFNCSAGAPMRHY